MLYVNASCNAYGAVFAQTNSIGNKIQKFLEVFMQGIDAAAASVIGQNLGAKKQDRAGKNCVEHPGNVHDYRGVCNTNLPDDPEADVLPVQQCPGGN